ncbi:MAG: hypothetical protein AB1650_07325 [Candidatus Omnitrophota bacterium]
MSQRFRREMLSFLLGFSAIIIQTILLRVFQTVFYGNELSYAVLLGFWLLWVSFGSFLATLVFSSNKAPGSLCILSFLALAMSAPAVIFGVRFIHPVLNISQGEMIGVLPMVISALLVTAPVGFIVGAIFVLLCLQSGRSEDSKGLDPSFVYFHESCGSAIGGALVSLILLRLLTPVRSMLLLSTLMVAVIFVSLKKMEGIKWVMIAVIFFLASFLILDFTVDLDFLSQEKQWPYGKLVAAEDSPYAGIAVVELEGAMSVFQNGVLSFTTNDFLSAEENVHFPLLVYPDPQRVLLIGGGLGGEIEEILKHPDVLLDYVEIDREMVDVVKLYLPRPEFLKNPRVRIYYQDPRNFIRTTSSIYDVVIVNAGDPLTAGTNRFYTLEFLTELDRVLAVGGIAGFRVSSSENYLSDENLLFLRTLFSTFKKVFPEVRSIPGATHTFLVSNLEDRIVLDEDQLSSQLAIRQINNRYVNENTLPFILDERRIQQMEKLLKSEEGLINRDLFPRGYLFNILLWSTHFNDGLKKLVVSVQATPSWALIAIVSMILLSAGFFSAKKNRTGGIDLAVTVTGFSEIVFEIVVILSFQSLYGIAYEKIGLILASFMLGLVAGARKSAFMNAGDKEELIAVFRKLQFGIIIYPLLLPVIFVIFRDMRTAQMLPSVFMFLFTLIPFIAGFLGGAQYPVAIALKKKIAGETEMKSAGFLYALDVLGAALGALLTGVFLIPLFGITAVCVLCSFMSAIVYLFIPGKK